MEFEELAPDQTDQPIVMIPGSPEDFAAAVSVDHRSSDDLGCDVDHRNVLGVHDPHRHVEPQSALEVQDTGLVSVCGLGSDDPRHLVTQTSQGLGAKRKHRLALFP